MKNIENEEISEQEIAAQFILHYCTIIPKRWPAIVSELNGVLKTSIQDLPVISYEFALAAIAVQIQALPNLLSETQAARIRQYIFECLTTEDVGSYPVEMIQQYEEVWAKALEIPENPVTHIAAALYDNLGCNSSVSIGDAKFKNPLLLAALSEKLIREGGPFWKTAIEKFRIMP